MKDFMRSGSILLITILTLVTSCTQSGGDENADAPKPAAPATGPSSYPTMIPGSANSTQAGCTQANCTKASFEVSANGSTQKRIDVTIGAASNTAFQAKALTPADHEVAIVKIETDSAMTGATPTVSGSSSASLAWTPQQTGATQGQIRVTVRDMTYCKVQPAIASTCAQNPATFNAQSDEVQVFQWFINGGNASVGSNSQGNNLSQIAIMGAGIGGLVGLMQGGLGGALSGALSGAMTGVLASSGAGLGMGLGSGIFPMGSSMGNNQNICAQIYNNPQQCQQYGCMYSNGQCYSQSGMMGQYYPQNNLGTGTLYNSSQSCSYLNYQQCSSNYNCQLSGTTCVPRYNTYGGVQQQYGQQYGQYGQGTGQCSTYYTQTQCGYYPTTCYWNQSSQQCYSR